MSIKLETLDANASLSSLENTIRQSEALGFEMITLARGIVDNIPSNTLTLRRRSPGDGPAPLTLIRVNRGLSLLEQETDVALGETNAKKLISYSAVFVSGAETNVAVYRE